MGASRSRHRNSTPQLLESKQPTTEPITTNESVPTKQPSTTDKQTTKKSTVKNRTQLKQIALMHKKLTEFPFDQVEKNAKSLKKIDVSSNQIEYLFRDLDTKRIETVFKQLGEQLEEFDVFDNRLKEIPEQLNQLTNLTLLNLGMNQLQSIQVSKLTKLQKLFLFMNHLKDVSLEDVQSLEVLDLSNNHLTKLPKGLLECGNLKRMDISANR